MPLATLSRTRISILLELCYRSLYCYYVVSSLILSTGHLGNKCFRLGLNPYRSFLRTAEAFNLTLTLRTYCYTLPTTDYDGCRSLGCIVCLIIQHVTPRICVVTMYLYQTTGQPIRAYMLL